MTSNPMIATVARNVLRKIRRSPGADAAAARYESSACFRLLFCCFRRLW